MKECQLIADKLTVKQEDGDLVLYLRLSNGEDAAIYANETELRFYQDRALFADLTVDERISDSFVLE